MDRQGYDRHARARLVAEPRKPVPELVGGQGRTPFERDRARVLHCAAFRRLAAKTQVHTAGEDDFPRTRLTHSLEVAQLAREMGARLGCDADIVDTAGLAHDLGHPPFGHNGEDVLDQIAAGCGGFEGNAQTLRVLTRLEAKVDRPDGVSAGLNLTRAVLDACCKYPWPRQEGQRKFAVYPDDLPVFDWLRDSVPVARRCIEAQVMDWADDVAYSVHDVEDGVYAGHIRLTTLDDAEERAALADQVSQVYSDENPADLRELLGELLADPLLPPVRGYDGGHRAQLGLKHAASVLIGRFVTDAVNATRARYGPQSLTRYAADLVVSRETRARCALLKGVALRYVMLRPGAPARYAQQQEILSELVHRLTESAPRALDPVFRAAWQAAPDDLTRLRVVVDQVASLTDASAAGWHHRLTG
ncbi:MAG TPA: deoxyguanosinetriphosphate triphosphohydrolase [Micromonosporaceae bacterium]|nr:deoxyguanosinetriphosphate triphosphohydrolase [Micromonosporaceae bacterium]